MTVALLLLILCVSAAIVRIGAFALELTGMAWEQAKFQALSAFSTTGYTTRESEQVVAHPMRRRIVSTLIIMGNAGIVTSIGTFAGTVMTGEPLDFAMNGGILLFGVLILFAILRHEGLTGRLRGRVQAWLEKRYDFSAPRADELLRLDEGYGLTRIGIDAGSPVLGKALKDLGLESWRVQVLGVERHGDFQPVPRGEDRFLAGDHLVVYGPEGAISKVFKPRESTRLTIMGEGLTVGTTQPIGPSRAAPASRPFASPPPASRPFASPPPAPSSAVPQSGSQAASRAAHDPTMLASGSDAEPATAGGEGRGRYAPVPHQR